MAAAPLRSAALALLLALAAGAAGAPPRRIVSLNPSLTAILLALGAQDALVGVDSFSAQQEPEVAGLPTVGGLYNPSLEAVVALAPDLVVFVPTVGDFVTPSLVGGPSSTMIGSTIQAQFGKANDWPFGSALSVIVMLVILAVVLAVLIGDKRHGSQS